MGHHGPVLSGIPGGHDHAHPYSSYSQDSHYNLPGPSSTSPAFAPHAYLHGGAASPFGSASSHRPAIFNEAGYSRMDQPNSIHSPLRDGFALGSAGANQTPLSAAVADKDVDKMFTELTNDASGDEGSGKSGDVERERAERERREREAKDRETKWEEGGGDMELFFDGP
jgi:histone demethylase JARID1